MNTWTRGSDSASLSLAQLDWKKILGKKKEGFSELLHRKMKEERQREIRNEEEEEEIRNASKIQICGDCAAIFEAFQ